MDLQPDGPDGAATVLVVDDEAAVRLLIRRALEPGVCRVLGVGDGEEALRIIEAGTPSLDLVVTDLVLPGLDGWDVIETLASHRPELPVLAMSAYAGEDPHPGPRGQGVPVLAKPFTLEELEAKISEYILVASRQRRRAEQMLERSRQALATNARIRAENAAMKDRVDLVAAAWEFHRRSHSP